MKVLRKISVINVETFATRNKFFALKNCYFELINCKNVFIGS